MKTRYQFGYDLGLFILWRTVAPIKFAKAIQPLLLSSGQYASWPEQQPPIQGTDLLPFFGNDLILRDGWRLYRGVNFFQREV